jgi:hypothetical protein
VSAKPWSAAFPRPRDEADPVGTMEGSRFYPDPVCRYTVESPALTRWACASRRLPRMSPDIPTTHRDSLCLLPMQHDKAEPHRGTFPGAAC